MCKQPFRLLGESTLNLHIFFASASTSTPLHDAHDNYSLQALCKSRQLGRALHALFLTPSSGAYLSVLQACIQTKSLEHVRAVCAQIAHLHLHPSALLAGYLVVAFAKCGAIEDALHLSRRLSLRNVYSWTAIISACVDFGRGLQALELHQLMLDDGVEPNAPTFASLFKACGDVGNLAQGKVFYDAACKRGFLSHAFVASSIVCMYGKCGDLGNAEEVFSSIPQRNAVSWNAMLSAYVERGEAEKALLAYRQMQEEPGHCEELTFVITLKGVGIFSKKENSTRETRESPKAIALEIVRALHKDASCRGYASHDKLNNTLISVYGKCGAISEAERVFSSMTKRDLTSWNAMLSQYSKQEKAERALCLYMEMHEQGISPNTLTYVSALQACCNMAIRATLSKAMLLDVGRALHIDAQRKGILTDARVCNTLLCMYGKCGTIVEVEKAFEALSQRDVVSWNVMLTSYVEQNMEEKALMLYAQMAKQDILFDHVTFSCSLQACSVLGSLDICNKLHYDAVVCGHDQITSVTATLLQAYASCASMADAWAVWNNLSFSNIFSWTACISGYAGEGSAVMSLHMFLCLMLEGNKLDGVLVTSALSACTRGGLVAEGLELFESMHGELSVTPDEKHLNSLIDLFARAGDLRKVENILQRSSNNAGLTSWLHVLAACRVHGDLKLAEHAFDYAVYLQPEDSIAYVLMSAVCVDTDCER
ncbi:hypothetical protein L7F22_050725 [Adiantum nelumboides]|nr:hypothetical protein [Adiantum nelumboides]